MFDLMFMKEGLLYSKIIQIASFVFFYFSVSIFMFIFVIYVDFLLMYGMKDSLTLFHSFSPSLLCHHYILNDDRKWNLYHILNYNAYIVFLFLESPSV